MALDEMKKRVLGGVKDWSRGYMKKRLMAPPMGESEGGDPGMSGASESEEAEQVSDGGEGEAPAAVSIEIEGGGEGGEDGGIPMRLSPEEAAMIEEMRAAKKAPVDDGMDMEGIDTDALSAAMSE